MAHKSRQGGEIEDGRRRRPVVLIAQQRQGRAQVAQRTSRCLLDVLQGGRGVLRVREVDGYTRAHVDGHQEVAERIVQLPRDLQTLNCGPAADLRLLLSCLALGPFLRGDPQRLPGTDRVPYRERRALSDVTLPV